MQKYAPCCLETHDKWKQYVFLSCMESEASDHYHSATQLPQICRIYSTLQQLLTPPADSYG